MSASLDASSRSLVTVDLAAVRANVGRLLSALRPGVRLCAVVKADAYGHGALEVGRAAVEAGAHMLAVVTSAEALELRSRAYSGPLLVMGPLFAPQEAVMLAAEQAEFTLMSLEMLELLQTLPAGPRYRVHLKIDSGMNRQGIPAERVAQALARLAELPSVEVVGVMTHFACADEDGACVGEQLLGFDQSVALVKAAWPAALAHAANSAATLNYPQSHFDMVRCGIGLYGLSPFQRDPDLDGLRPALSWTSTVAAVKELAGGQAAGYGHTFRTAEATCLALVPLGYADGVRRDLSNRGQVLVGGRRYPMAGRVSMDSFLIDLGPATGVRAGDRVTLIGRDGEERVTMEETAGILGTINYEVACGISLRRATRTFLP